MIVSCIIDHPAVTSQINAEIQQHGQINSIINHAEVDTVADYISK